MRFMQRIQQFMVGRYGFDGLSVALLVLYCILMTVARFTSTWVELFALAAIALLFWRVLSKNIFARQRENAKFMMVWRPIARWFKEAQEQARDRNHKFIKCPDCKARLRLPRGRGKIEITCPRCRKIFQRRT